MSEHAEPPSPPVPERLPALDWLRGLVMALMAVDHVDAVVNAQHAQGDSVAWQQPYPLSAPDFLTRFCSHLCAPTFVFLAGAGIALSRASTGHLLLRGLVLVALELTLVSSYWRAGEGGGGWSLFGLPVFVQVIAAIGVGMLVTALVRRLPSVVLGLAIVALLVVCEVVRRAAGTGWEQPLWRALAFTGGVWRADGGRGWPFDLMVLYAVVPWIPVMLGGLCFGRLLQAGRVTPARVAVAGLVAFAVFAAIRGIDGFGNMGLHRRGPGVLEWLHTSKYPPSLAFLALELGLMALLLAPLLAWQRRRAPLWTGNPLLILGQVPMFYYLLHLPLIGVGLGLGVLRRERTFVESWWGAALVVAAALPFCAAYRWYKQTYRHRWTRYL